MRVRLREVAERAGVSEATVSRVLNERPHVSARTKAAVLDALRALNGPMPGGRPRPLPHRSGLVAIVMPDLDNPIFAVMAQLLTARLAHHEHPSVIARCGTAWEEPQMLETLAAAGVAAMIVVSGAHADTTADIAPYQHLIDTGVTLAFVNGFRSELAAPFVSCDDRHAAALAVQHLVSLGHRRIAFVSGPHRHTVVQRKLAGYLAALAAAGIDPDESLVVETIFSAEAGHAAVEGLVGAGATAAVTASDMVALGTIRGARDLGLQVPEQWSVIGYDDTTLMAYTDPPLTTVRQPVRAMCEATADLVSNRLAGRPAHDGELLFRPELVVRSSTAPFTPNGPRAAGRS